ncbi:hypothetical protein Q9L58_010481 [Maublancomyces gigas]|uniref:Uncharacterized protein n=1 Tax=Discina gigas TaxID=1032678 RepID=A0ABR3G4F9_9PEZI
MPAMTWGSEICWTGMAHILRQVSPAYNLVTRTITGLPRWTPLRILLREAGMPPIDLLLDKIFQQYGIRTIRQKAEHQYTRILTGTGLQRIANLMRDIIQNPPQLEDIQDIDLTGALEAPEIGLGEEEKATAHGD